MNSAPTRRRDPNRRAQILDAAALLLSERGFAGVSMAEIGADVGIAASAIYWHFPSKQALLVALFDTCLDGLRTDQLAAVERLGRTREAMVEVFRLHVEFVVHLTALARVYYQEQRNLAPDDLRRLRSKQRDYVTTSTDLLRAGRPELDVERAEALVHAAIGAAQSGLVQGSRCREATEELLLTASVQVLDSPA